MATAAEAGPPADVDRDDAEGLQFEVNSLPEAARPAGRSVDVWDSSRLGGPLELTTERFNWDGTNVIVVTSVESIRPRPGSSLERELPLDGSSLPPSAGDLVAESVVRGDRPAVMTRSGNLLTLTWYESATIEVAVTARGEEATDPALLRRVAEGLVFA